ncbi:hypothetical protein IWQ60_002558 [Tieghemiomyces parasiticus]|uniref:RRM domain-containing protein n=1 Tax=Tieghemiomyces parasiticus TaxID=78921 RepID=A0A9W8AC15_9FUNG|nr:hypothetical protein IWQ60_002558 [Tieghemiomyces parasiticus]
MADPTRAPGYPEEASSTPGASGSPLYPSTLLPAHPVAAPYGYYPGLGGSAHQPTAASPPLSPYGSPGPASPYLAHSPHPGATSPPFQSPPTSPFYYYSHFVHSLDPRQSAVSPSSVLTSPGVSATSPRGGMPLSPSFPTNLLMSGGRMYPMPPALSPGRPGEAADRGAGLESLRDNTNVYIRNLPHDMTDDGLNCMCATYGKITSSKAILDDVTQACKGFGFVMYESIEETNYAITKLNEAGYQASLAKDSFKTRLKNMQDRSSTNVYLSNLPLNMTEKDLVTLFADYKVVSPRILRNNEENASRGVGFVRLADRESAVDLIQKFNGKTLPGGTAPLQIRFADSAAQKKLKSQSGRRRSSRSKEGESSRSSRDPGVRLGDPTAGVSASSSSAAAAGSMSPVYYHPGVAHPSGLVAAMVPPHMYAGHQAFPHFPVAAMYSGLAVSPHYQPSIDQLTSGMGQHPHHHPHLASQRDGREAMGHMAPGGHHGSEAPHSRAGPDARPSRNASTDEQLSHLAESKLSL